MRKVPNLDTALCVIHQGRHHSEKRVNVELRSAPEPGDHECRQSYFDLEDRPRQGGEALLQLHRTARLRDYRTPDGVRTNRSMITVPPRLRDTIQEFLEDPSEPWTTGLIALAEFGAQVLRSEQTVLVVTKARHMGDADE